MCMWDTVITFVSVNVTNTSLSAVFLCMAWVIDGAVLSISGHDVIHQCRMCITIHYYSYCVA